MLHQSTLLVPHEPDRLIQKICEGFRREWGIELKSEPFSEDELDQAAEASAALCADPSRSYLPEDSFLPACPAGRREATFLA